MSDREFRGFAVDTVADAVRQPPLEELRAAARDRRRRRRAIVLAALAVIVVTSAAIPVSGGPQRLEFADPRPTDTQIRGVASDLIVLSDAIAVVVEVAEGCKVSFAATDDGGRRWSAWRVARHDTTCTDTTDVRYSVLSGRSYLVRFDNEWLLSTDAGQTWKDAAATITAVAAFPAKARLVSCRRGCGALVQPLAVDPASGQVYRLSGAPPSPFPPASIYPTPDGTLWVTYWPGDYPRPATVARSIDRGATWQTSRAPEETTTIGIAGVDDQEAYLLTEPWPADTNGPPPAGPSRLLHTTDGGKSWQDVATDLATNNVNRPITVGSDGSLMVVDYHESYSELLVSRDGGRHFSSVRQQGDNGQIDAGPGLAWSYQTDRQSVIGTGLLQVTTEGRTWTRFLLPD